MANEITIVVSAHPTLEKNISERIWRKIRKAPHLVLVRPVTYSRSLALTWHSTFVVTDSGGSQREAFWLGRPSVKVGRSTEWPETLLDDTSSLVRPHVQDILSRVRRILRYGRASGVELQPRRTSAFGDGKASEKILHDLRQHLAKDRARLFLR